MIRIIRKYIDDKAFNNRFEGEICNHSTAVCFVSIWNKDDIIIYIRKSEKRILYLILLLIHEYIHAFNFIIFGWNYKLRMIQDIFDYLNEIIWVIIREIIKAVYKIIRNEQGYFNSYWRKI